MTDRLPEGLLTAWFVAFTDSSGDLWFHRPLRRGFRHCLAFAWDETARVWVLLSPGFDGVILRALDDAAIGRLLAHLRTSKATILLAGTRAKQAFRLRFLLTCSSAIGVVLGIGEVGALTPYRLYRTLMANGAMRVM